MIAPNTLLQNRYLVQQQIGQGGMGAVYIATDQRFGSTVALKETFFEEAGMRKAFEREARLLNHLRHAALPRVSDHFVEEEGQFLVMEYIPGDDLADKLKERGAAFPMREVLEWADQLLDALDYLHTQEPPVIHRDIKPQNLKLTPRNHIVLLDFGLAKGTGPLQTKVTATGSVFGYSRHYAPLEQIQGTGTDPRSDIYSLAATLYHLMTGAVPPDALTRATAVLNGADDPLRLADEVHAQVSPSVAGVLHRSMALNAGQRPQTAALMREALREAARQGDGAGTLADLKAATSATVYEQETQIIGSAAKGTSAGAGAAEKTGALNALEGATVTDGGQQTGRGGERTKADPEESVVTKVTPAAAAVASARGAAKPGSSGRGRAVIAAAIGVVLLGLGALAYHFTRNAQPAATENANTQSAASTPATPSPTAPPAENVNVSTAATPAATPAPVARRTPPKSPRAETEATPDENEMDNGDNETPEPPETPDRPGPNVLRDRRGRVIVLPPGMSREEIRRIVEEQRRAADAARRESQERKREILQKELERARQRRQQQQQQQQP